MSNADLTSIIFVLLLLVGLAQLLGYLFVKLHQPKVIGEIPAGIVLGPAVIACRLCHFRYINLRNP